MNKPKILTDSRGEGRTVLLVPGVLTGWRSWVPHQELLAKKYRTIRTQLFVVESGLRNEPLPEDYSVQWECDALAQEIDALDLDTFDIVAWSFGSAVSLSYAIHHRERIRTLTLIEPPAIWVLKSLGPLSESLEEERKMIAKLAPGQVTDDELVWFTHFAGFVPQNIDPRTLPSWPVWTEHKQSLRNGDAVFRHRDDMSLVRNFQPPVLLVKGTGSSKFLHDIIDTLADQFPHTTLIELPGGHAPQIISMQPFMDSLTAFFSTNE
jgi:pimeloyl-ACP methyl ester carboxylesterase